jgi:transposase
MGPHQQFLLQEQLALVNSVEASIERVNQEIARRLQVHTELAERLDDVPGIGPRIIQIILAEIGPDLTRFPSAAHLASWAGLCPGNHESAGQQRTGRTRKGNPWLRSALVEAAQAAARVKHSYLAAQFRRLAARRGIKRALIAVAHSLLSIIYALVTRRSTYTTSELHTWSNATATTEQTPHHSARAPGLPRQPRTGRRRHQLSSFTPILD